MRSIGNDLHMDYTGGGPDTHLAARMEKLARPGSILLSEETHRLTEGYLAVTPRGPIPVRGVAEAVEVYEAVGAGPARSRLQAAAVRGLTPFVGRDAELGLLRQALERAEAGRGQIVALVGEAGVGKSPARGSWQSGPARLHSPRGPAGVYRKSTAWRRRVWLRAYFDSSGTLTRRRCAPRSPRGSPALTAVWRPPRRRCSRSSRRR